MSDIPNTDDYTVSTNAIRWEMTKLAVLEGREFLDADIEKRINMLVYGFAKTIDIDKQPEVLKNPFAK